LIFAFQCFGVPDQRGGKRHLSSLASKVNTAIANFPIASPPAPNSHKPAGIKKRSTSSDVAALVSSKLEEGDIRGAIRLAASDDTMAPFDDVTAVALHDKHPSTFAISCAIPLPNDNVCLRLQESVLAAVKSFLPGSAGGLYGFASAIFERHGQRFSGRGRSTYSWSSDRIYEFCASLAVFLL
jgi:hypothetical protein